MQQQQTVRHPRCITSTIGLEQGPVPLRVGRGKEHSHLKKSMISLRKGEFYSQAQEIVQRCIFPNRAAEERAIRDALCLGMRSQRVKDK